MKSHIVFPFLLMSTMAVLGQIPKKTFSYLDVFKLEYAVDPQIAPNGQAIVYRRTGFDIMEDRSHGNLWLITTDGTQHIKLTTREASEFSPRWSPDGDRIAFVSNTDEGAEIYMYWISSGKVARISQLEKSPSSLSWSADGKWLAFSMKVAEAPPIIAKMPKKPKGANWAKPPRITDRLKHEADGRGYVPPGFDQLFVIPAEGGAPRQLTEGNFHHNGKISWSPDGRYLYFSSNRNENWEYDYVNSEIYRVAFATGSINALTDRKGPDSSPTVSPNGKYIAYISFEDKVQTYQVRELYLMNADGSEKKSLTSILDRSVSNIRWDAASKGLYFSYTDKGNTKIAYTDLKGNIRKLADHLGASVGRPYSGGYYSVSQNGTIAYTHCRPEYPSDIALLKPREKNPKLLTQLNKDILPHRNLGRVEEIWYPSSVDGRNIQGWIVKPPNYEDGKTYPLIVEIHGGPILNYGDRFSSEMQLYAAAGYVVFYPNPRGSTGYGEAFGNLLYNNYPGDDYHDIMDGVDYLINRDITSKDQLYVTGGSAGGIMAAWMIGKNNRFKAAVVAKPVMNWISKTLVADNYYGYAHYRYPGQPWENMETYWKFSPISLVGNIQTPTMVMVGMNDLRTPPSEAKQLYHALKLRKIETVLVEIPEASHGIANKPSNLIAKVAHILAWFDKFSTKKE